MSSRERAGKQHTSGHIAVVVSISHCPKDNGKENKKGIELSGWVEYVERGRGRHVMSKDTRFVTQCCVVCRNTKDKGLGTQGPHPMTKGIACWSSY